MAMNRNTAFMTLLFVDILGGIIGLSSRTLFGYGLDPFQVTCIRMTVTTITMGLVMLAFDRGSMRIHRKDIWLFLVFGVSKLMSDAFLFEAQYRIDLSLSTILQLVFPYYVLIMSHFLFGERISRVKILSVVLGFGGCILVTGHFEGMSHNDVLGVLFAIVSGLAMAVYTIGCRYGSDRGYGATTMLFYFYLVGSLSSLLFVDASGILDVIAMQPVSILHMLFLGVVLTAVPYYLHIRTMEVLDPGTVSIVLLFEAVVASIVGVIVYQEYLSMVNIFGMLLVFSSMIILNRDGRQSAESAD